MVSGPLKPFVTRVIVRRAVGIDPLAFMQAIPVGFDNIGQVFVNISLLVSNDQIEAGLKILGKQLVEAVKANTPIGATSNLRDSTDFKVTKSTGVGGEPTMLLEITQNATSRSNSFKYQVAVRRGRKPGKQPPSTALESWVNKKLGISLALTPGVAYKIARSIKKKGIKGNEYYFRTLRENEAVIQKAADSMSAKLVIDLMGRIRVETQKAGISGFSF